MIRVRRRRFRRRLPSLVEHNESFRCPVVDSRAGVLCGVCRSEMHYEGTSINLSNPPSRWVRCPECGARGVKLVAA